MKIFNWNCNGGFREDFKAITDKKLDTYVDADIFVIQECEDPEKEGEEYKEYREFAGEKGKNYFWIGNEDQSKGLGIFAKDHVTLEKIGEWDKETKYFLAVRVDDSFNLLGVWAMDPYVEMIHDFIDSNKDNGKLFDGNLIMCGDFNSNRIWNYKHTKKDDWKKAKNHDNLNCKLNDKGLYSIYHGVTGEKLKKCEEDEDEELKQETKNTFFLYRHLNKPFHIDYFYANEDLINNAKWRGYKEDGSEKKENEFEILERWQWISMSDHLPLVLNLREKIEFESEYVLHKLTQENLKLFDLEFVASERQITENETLEMEDAEGVDETSRVDNIAFDREKKTLTLIEYKNVKDSDVIGQAQGYLELIEKYPEKFAERRFDEFGNKEKEPKEYDFENTKVMIIGPEFTQNQLDNIPENFELWIVSLYDCGNNKGVVEYKNVKTRKILELNIDLRDLELTENDVIEKNVPEDMREEISALYCSFRKKVTGECDVKLIPLSNGVSFRVNNQIACIVYFNKYSIKLHYNAIELDGCEKLVKIPEDKNYVGNFELKLNPGDNVDCAFKLFEKVYNEKMGE